MRKGKTISSNRWLQRNQKDKYVILAKKFGYRSRAAFKLADIDKKYKLITKSSSILDVGAYPGSWSQYIGSFPLDFLEYGFNRLV